MPQRTYLDRAAMLAAPDLKTEEVYVPQWGGYVRVRALTAHQRDVVQDAIFKIRQARKGGIDTEMSMQGFRSRVVAMSVVDESGKRVFTDADIEALGEKNSSAIDVIFDVATRLSGMDDGSVEELAKNSEGSQSEGSSSV